MSFYQLLELKKDLTNMVSAMWKAKRALYEASDGFTYSLHRLLSKNILDPVAEDAVAGKLSNSVALDHWWWHTRNADFSYVLFTDNKDFCFDTVDGISPLIEKEVGSYCTLTTVVYRDAETIDKIVSNLSEMLNPDSELTEKDWCLSNLLTI